MGWVSTDNPVAGGEPTRLQNGNIAAKGVGRVGSVFGAVCGANAVKLAAIVVKTCSKPHKKFGKVESNDKGARADFALNLF